VLSTGGRTEKAAVRLLPELPEVCFVEVGDFTGAALQRAVERGLSEVVFVGMVGKLTKLASGVLMTHYTRSKVDAGLLADLTAAGAGPDDTVEAVRVANSARHAYELWQQAGVLRQVGDLLCARVAAVLAAYGQGKLAADVVMVDFEGHDVVAGTGRWAA
jgi:cobalt-precorrin-5B (C1)-methyltransferase